MKYEKQQLLQKEEEEANENKFRFLILRFNSHSLATSSIFHSIFLLAHFLCLYYSRFEQIEW